MRRPIDQQVRGLAAQAPAFVELMTSLAQKHRMYILAGTIPILDAGERRGLQRVVLLRARRAARAVQGKLHMTRFEVEDWKVRARSGVRVFNTDFGKVGVAICYDVEFPEIARAAARAGAHILLVPSCTDDRQGFLRVRYCAQARAIENQMYVVVAHTVGSLPMVPAVSLNYGQAAILTPSDFAFSRDGILAEGHPNQEMMVIGELNLDTILDSRMTGTVLPLNDSRNTASIVADLEEVSL